MVFNLPSLLKLTKDLLFKHREYDETYNQKVVNQIRKAWKEGSGADQYGRIWVDARFLHTILRTTKNNADKKARTAPQEDKRTIDGCLYIRGSRILEMMDRDRETATTAKKAANLGVSIDTYISMQESGDVEKIRTISRENLKQERSKLKKKRWAILEARGALFDELTGKPLVKRTCQFSHIRSYSLYPEVGTEVENGLLVNKETHSIITQNNVDNEQELKTLCEDKNWSLEWYEPFIKKFGGLKS